MINYDSRAHFTLNHQLEENGFMIVSDSIISNDNFFSQGLIHLLGRRFIEDFFLIIDLDFNELDSISEMFNTEKKIIVFTSKNISSFNHEFIFNINILDKRCSAKEILKYFTTHRLTNEPYVELLLTRRERQMLKILLSGEKISLIAKKLGVSRKTIYSHRRSMMSKLGCKNRIDFYKLCLDNKCFSNLIH